MTGNHSVRQTDQREHGTRFRRVGGRPGLLAWLALPVALAACGPGEMAYVYRQGATVAEADAATFDCRIAAAKEVPAATQVRSTPAWNTPTYTNCQTSRNGQTNCVTSGGYQMGGDVYSFDRNAALRAEYFRRCLADRGFAIYQLPGCSRDAVTPTLRQQLAGVQRSPATGACVVQVTAAGANLLLPEEIAGGG